jgi:predicted amidophosphoribosyltransferase
MTFLALMRRCGAGFTDSSTGKTRVAILANLNEQEVEGIQSFLAFFERAVCLGVNKHLRTNFTGELDFCLALDFNKPTPQDARTEIGEWEYQAKYHGNKEALAHLADRMAVAIRRIPRPMIPKPRLITYVPPAQGKKSSLPSELVAAVIKRVPEDFWGVPNPMVVPTLSTAKPSAKNLRVTEKLAHWEAIVQGDGLQLSRRIRSNSILVLDDLYQSGVSLWSLAKYLKVRQAGTVVGLVCVKSLRDTDNT